LKLWEQRIGSNLIVLLTTGQMKADRITKRIHQGVDLGRQPTLAAAGSLSSPAFWGRRPRADELVLSGLAPASIICALGRAATSRHAASRMASTVTVRRRNWSLRRSAGTDWLWREQGRRKLRSSS